MKNLNTLEQIAKGATPGPYQFHNLGVYSEAQPFKSQGWGGNVAIADGDNDALYLATFSPDVVLGLIQRIKELEAK